MTWKLGCRMQKTKVGLPWLKNKYYIQHFLHTGASWEDWHPHSSLSSKVEYQGFWLVITLPSQNSVACSTEVFWRWLSRLHLCPSAMKMEASHFPVSQKPSSIPNILYFCIFTWEWIDFLSTILALLYIFNKICLSICICIHLTTVTCHKNGKRCYLKAI